MEKKFYDVKVDLRVKGTVFCTPEGFQDAVEQMVYNAEFDEYQMGSVDWEEVDMSEVYD